MGLKGDANHSFVQQLKHIITNEKKTRENVRLARRDYGNLAIASKPNRLKVSQIAERYGVNENTIIDEYNQSRTALTSAVTTSIAEGKVIPSESQISKITYDYNMAPAGRDAFIQLGNEYIQHCQGKPDSHLNIVTEAQSTAKTESLAILEGIIANRMVERATGSILPRDNRLSFSTNGDYLPLSISALKTKFGFDREIDFMQGKPRKSRQPLNISGLLETLKVTDAKEKKNFMSALEQIKLPGKQR